MQLFLFSLVSLLLIFGAPVRGSPHAAPQGVYDIIKPQGSYPAGCLQTSDFRFGMVPHPGAPPIGPMKTVCETTNTLSMMLRSSVLTDKLGRIGSIVSNRQFQFDGPPAQAGAIYTAGFSICPEDSTLALGSSKVFHRCSSGTFYNIYDQSIGGQCEPVYLRIMKIIQC